MRHLPKSANLLLPAVTAAAIATAAIEARADGGGGSVSGIPETTTQKRSGYAAAVELVKSRDYRRAISSLERVVAEKPKHVDALNYLGYSHRKLGELKRALAYYRRALAIDPDHKGANEYLGELYVRNGDLARAEAQLAKLDRLCDFGCNEYEELKRKVAALRQKRGG